QHDNGQDRDHILQVADDEGEPAGDEQSDHNARLELPQQDSPWPDPVGRPNLIRAISREPARGFLDRETDRGVDAEFPPRLNPWLGVPCACAWHFTHSIDLNRYFQHTLLVAAEQLVSPADLVERKAVRQERLKIDSSGLDQSHQTPHALLASGAKRR